jgi:glyoxylate reductase
MSKRFRVLVSTEHAYDVVEYFGDSFDAVDTGSTLPLSETELQARLKDCDALVAVIEDRIDERLLTACPNLKVVANVAVGYDNVDIAAANKHGVLICNTPGVLDGTTADLAFALLLACARRIVEAHRYVQDGQWQRWTADLLLGTDVGAKTLGIIGLGRIGQAMAKRARGFDMKLLYSQRNRAPVAVEESLQAQYVSMPELLQQSDFISIHCPLTADTKNLIGEREFAMMKPQCFLINTARGAIVNEEAMIAALQSKRIAGAGLDVFAREPQVPAALLKMDNVVMAPHIGSASVETRSAMARLAADGVINGLQSKLPKNAVNPQVWPRLLERLKVYS